MPEHGDLYHTEGGASADRAMEMLLQHTKTAQFTRLQASGPTGRLATTNSAGLRYRGGSACRWTMNVPDSNSETGPPNKPRSARGKFSEYHNNGFQAWRLESDGKVYNVGT